MPRKSAGDRECIFYKWAGRAAAGIALAPRRRMTIAGTRRVVIIVLSAAVSLASPAEAAAERARVGLALGGGSAKGMAHVGVLRWLEEHHVPVDAIAGTSSGAFIGGAYATGMSAEQIQTMLRDADWDLILSPDVPYPLKSVRRKEDDRAYSIKLEAGLRHGFRLQSGLNPGHRIGLLLSRMTFAYSSVENFDDLPIPFRCVATGLEKGDTVVLDRGPLGPALRASMALPGTFDPVRLNGRLLSDGGILNNVPVDVARAMGMDVVIAVSVGEPDKDRPAETIGAVANRAIDLMMQELAERRLRDADVVIRPRVDDLKSTDYRKSDDIAARGYAAAEAQSQHLLRYALDDEAWAAHTREREARQHPKTGPVTFVEVRGVSGPAAAQVASRFEPDLSTASDPTVIESHLDWAIGLGRYASAMYERTVKEGRDGLAIEIRDKSYAPPFVRFSLDLDNESKDVNLALGSRLTMMDVLGQGSEWRVDATVGSTLRLATELHRPLGGSGPIRRGAFMAPHFQYSRISENLYEDGDLAAIYSRQSAGFGLDLGWHVGRTTEFRVGYDLAYVRNATRVGEVLPRSRGEEQKAHLRFTYDGQDRAHFATRGARLRSSASWMVDGPDSSRAFGRAESALDVAWKVSDRHQIIFHGTGGLSFGKPLPFLYQFSLGGPFRLSSFPPQAFRGSHFALGSVGYRMPLGRLPGLLGDRLFLAALVEVGSAFDRVSDARLETSFTGGLAADTFFGPFFVGASVGRQGGVRAYFIVGSLVR